MCRRVLIWSVAALTLVAGPLRAAGGSVRGTVVLEPMKPPPARPGYKKVETKKPIENPEPAAAIVYLEREDGKQPKPSPGRALEVRQSGYQFRPSVLAVPVGGEVRFPNEDDEFHNVFSYSRIRRFDLGRFRKDEESPLVSFDKPGLVKIYCEIHPHMRCLVLVLDTPWFASTDAQGRFQLKEVPPGNYRLKAFLPSEKTLETRVTVAEGRTTAAEFPR